VSAIATIPAADAESQQIESAEPTAAAFVFLDCNAPNCDFDHFRREIPWVNWVRDREAADVHLLVTAEPTGGGGWFYTLDYLGGNGFDGLEKSLTYVSDPEDTDTEARNALTRIAGLGLVQFVEGTEILPHLRIEYDAESARVLQTDQADPWNLWSFELGVSGSLEGEATENASSFRGSIEANRVAEALKTTIRITGRYEHQEYQIEEDNGTISTETNTQEDHSADGLVVWSLGDHWSLGGRANASRSTFQNRDFALFTGPAIEYNVFPYDESTRRAITFRYTVELAAFDYMEQTVELKTSQVLPRHTLTVSARVQQPWGEINGSVEGIQYLNDPRTHRINTFLNIEYRLFRGFSVDLFGRISRIKDQFFLPAEGLSAADILLERQQRETGYQYDVSLGFSYRFGSQFANVVNPRMSGGGRRGPPR